MATSHETDWQSEKTLVERMRYMLDNEISTDVCFEVGPPGGETVNIRAHKCMLIASSPVFEAMFSSGMAECQGAEAKVRIEDIDADIFKELLNYMYGESPTVTSESAVSLIYAARKYLLNKLATECCNSAIESIDSDNVLWLLESSVAFNHHELKHNCVELISINAEFVFTRKEILSASRQAMKAILEANFMSVSEVVVYETAVDWAKHQLQRTTLGKSPTDLQIREALGDLLYQIHFPAMKPSDFAEISGSCDILTLEEKDSIYYYIATKKDRQLKFPTKTRIGEENWVDRTLGNGSKRWHNTHVDAINFVTDKDLFLTGVGLFAGYEKSGYEVVVEIMRSDNLVSKSQHRVSYCAAPAPCKVAFDTPIFISAGVVHSVKALASDNIAHYSHNCRTVCVKEKITFTFSKNSESVNTNEYHGQIPRLYFCSM